MAEERGTQRVKMRVKSARLHTEDAANFAREDAAEERGS